MLWKIFDIADNEQGFLYRREQLQGVLTAGRHRFSRWQGDLRVERFDISEPGFKHPQARFLLQTHNDLLSPFVASVEMGDQEIGLVYRNQRLFDLLAPGDFYAFWKGCDQISIERIQLTENLAVPDQLLGVLGRGANAKLKQLAQTMMVYSEVPDQHNGLLFINGKLQDTLQPGRYGFWLFNRHVQVFTVDMRVVGMDVTGQEILTKDRVSLRINLSANYQVTDASTAYMKVKEYTNFIYRELQFGLRETVGEKTLDELLAEKDALNARIQADVRDKLALYGIALLSVGVKDIVLPGDMKAILNQVVEAQKEAEANLIKRREETQAMRSLHNTAKMMENNPVLLRLKELEALERVAGKIDQLTVYGGLEGVMQDLVKLTGPRSKS